MPATAAATWLSGTPAWLSRSRAIRADVSSTSSA
jgi:hypothetical protein